LNDPRTRRAKAVNGLVRLVPVDRRGHQPRFERFDPQTGACPARAWGGMRITEQTEQILGQLVEHACKPPGDPWVHAAGTDRPLPFARWAAGPCATLLGMTNP